MINGVFSLIIIPKVSEYKRKNKRANNEKEYQRFTYNRASPKTGKWFFPEYFNKKSQEN